ncbi:MAG: 50S ribosomal protein L29 [Candidatus Woesearchaeota archaeon]|nr:50S ribosomal protein L29 [Candidatus Woesearchaeota archaeon]
MSSKKMKEFRGLSENELKKRIDDLRKELVKMNAQVATGTMPKSPGLVKNTKKSIAMIMTLQREKEIAALSKVVAEKKAVKVNKEASKKTEGGKKRK